MDDGAFPSSAGVHPQTNDISFEFSSPQQKSSDTTTFTFVDFADRSIIFLTDLAKIGNIIEIQFTKETQMLTQNGFTSREEFNTHLIMGTDTDDYDFLVMRVAKLMLKYGRVVKPICLFVGLKSTADEKYLRMLLAKLEGYLADAHK